MGFSISGIILEDNFNNDISRVSENLEMGLEIIGLADPYEAVSRIKDPQTVFICFSEIATLMYCNASLYDQNIYSQTANTLNFQYFESAMIFAIRYVRDCKRLRSILSISGQIEFELGRKMKIETEFKKMDEVVINLTQQKSDLNILRISDTNKIYKCRIKEYTGQRNRMSELEVSAMLMERRIGGSYMYGREDLFSNDY